MKHHPSKRMFVPVGLFILLLIGILFIPQIALAHQTLNVGDYAVEYGWVSEPAVVGQPNAVVINLSNPNVSGDIDVSALQIQMVYGDQSKVLTLQPLGENTPGQFIAPVTPMLPGKYTIHLGGKIGATDFNNDVQPEEVQTADAVQFPLPSASSNKSAAASLGLPGWLGIAGILLGLAGIVLGLLSMLLKPAMK